MAPTAFTLTDLPLIGMTVGNDGTWSARVWEHLENGAFAIEWMPLVKSVGLRLTPSFNNKITQKPKYREMLFLR